METEELLDLLIQALPSVHAQHIRSSPFYALARQLARNEVERLFTSSGEAAVSFGPFGAVALPYHRMGAVDSLNLFDIDELIIFSFYWANRGLYRRSVDIGANLGLHSIVMSRCGFTVDAYEPDPVHFEILNQNLARNGCSSVTAHNAAISSAAGQQEFIRVLGNTTGSHLAGSKTNPYGELEKFTVEVAAIDEALRDIDLMKLDAEGHEKEILLATRPEHWATLDALVEVGSEGNAGSIYEHFRNSGINLFAQKTNWQRLSTLEEMPTSHRDGTLFISRRSSMPWGMGS